MSIHYVSIPAQIRRGKLEIELPSNVAEGEIYVQVPVLDEAPLSDEELSVLTVAGPRPGIEIAHSPVIGSWAYKGIVDGVEWEAEQRKKRQERNAW
jgi:hypothetical protein